MTHPTTVAAAHDYSARGWRIIALHSVGPDGVTCSCNRGRNCTSKGKHPINTGWESAPRLSGADIEAIWEKRPNANVGIATGDESGFWVLDIDPKSGGFETMQRLTEEHGKLGATFTVQTGSGGYHYYFTMPDFPVTNSAGQLKNTGVDVRGAGGQVVAAPSVTDKGEYVVKADQAIAPAPDWLLDLIRSKSNLNEIVTTDDVQDRSQFSQAEQDRLDKYAERAVKGNLDRLDAMQAAATPDPAKYRGEAWNNTSFEVTCSLIELANSPWTVYTKRQAAEDLYAHAPRDTEFDDSAVKAVWDSAQQKIGDKARPVPEGQTDDIPDFFNGRDVRKRPFYDAPTAAVSHIGDSPLRFFDKGQLNAVDLSDAVLAEEPIAYGADNAFWAYRNGVWVSDSQIVERRVVHLLGDKIRPQHVATATLRVKHIIRRLDCGPVSNHINFRNGMLPWEATDKLEPHSPDFGSTVQMAVDWRPDAQCPLFDKYLSEVLNPDYIRLVWEMLGYLMYSGNKLQVAFLLHGPGGNGKTKLLDVISAMLGSDSIATQSLDQLNGNRFSPANLFGKTANIAGDIDGTYQESTASFKKLTGGDLYSGERKFGNSFSFVSWAVPVFSANKIPGSVDVTEGYLRRWVMVDFNRGKISDEHRDLDLSDKLIDPAELEGVAAHAVRSLRTLMQRNHFDMTGEPAAGQEKFAEAIDKVRYWARTGALTAPGHFETAEVLYQAYTGWALRSGYGKFGLTEFMHRLEAIGFNPVTEGVPGYVGLMVAGIDSPTLASPASFFEGASNA